MFLSGSLEKIGNMNKSRIEDEGLRFVDFILAFILFAAISLIKL